MRKRPLNTRQKRFIENHILKGMSIAESVRRAGYLISSGRSEDFSSVGCRILKTDRVASEVKKLREKQFEKDALTFAEKRAFLARAVRTSVDQVGASSDLAQEVSEEVDQDGRVKRKVKVVDRLRALELDSRLAGDFHADRSPQVSNPFLFIVSLSKTEGQTDSLGDAQQAASVGRLPHSSGGEVIEAEIMERTASDTSNAGE
jgi:phage terminase small subunit